MGNIIPKEIKKINTTCGAYSVGSACAEKLCFIMVLSFVRHKQVFFRIFYNVYAK